MQIVKTVLLAYPLAVAILPLYSQAEDNEAQAAARAAVRQKIQELNGQTAVAQPEAAPAEPPKPFVLPVGASPDLIEQARQATRARIAELRTNSSPATPEAAPAAPAPSRRELREAKEREAAARRAEMKAKKQAEAEAKAKEIAEAKEQQAAAAREKQEAAAREKEAAMARQREAAAAREKEVAEARERQAAAAKEKEDAAAKAKISALQAKVEPAPYQPPGGAPTGLPAWKEERLHQLNSQYEADQMSAEDYHEQRAKLLAQEQP